MKLCCSPKRHNIEKLSPNLIHNHYENKYKEVNSAHVHLHLFKVA